jgi:hypothetical protein
MWTVSGKKGERGWVYLVKREYISRARKKPIIPATLIFNEKPKVKERTNRSRVVGFSPSDCP